MFTLGSRYKVGLFCKVYVIRGILLNARTGTPGWVVTSGISSVTPSMTLVRHHLSRKGEKVSIKKQTK